MKHTEENNLSTCRTSAFCDCSVTFGISRGKKLMWDFLIRPNSVQFIFRFLNTGQHRSLCPSWYFTKRRKSNSNKDKTNSFTVEFNKTAKSTTSTTTQELFLSGVQRSEPFAEKAGTSGIREPSCELNCLKVPGCYQTALMWWISGILHSFSTQ